MRACARRCARCHALPVSTPARSRSLTPLSPGDSASKAEASSREWEEAVDLMKRQLAAAKAEVDRVKAAPAPAPTAATPVPAAGSGYGGGVVVWCVLAVCARGAEGGAWRVVDGYL